MAELQIAYREWLVDFDLTSDDEVPDLPKPFTTITLRPEFGVIKFEARGSHQVRFQSMRVSGPRVNKNGLGAMCDVRWYEESEMPDWARDLVAAGRKLVEGSSD